MLVFIDESGDPGFKLGQGSSDTFAVAMVQIAKQDAGGLSEAIRTLQQELALWPEFKFSKCKAAHKKAFFELALQWPWKVRAIVVQKRLIHSDRLRSMKSEFYRFITQSLVKNDGGTLQNAEVIIDGSGEKVFRQDLQRHLKRHAPGIRKVSFAASHKDPLIQLADMAVGAIAQSYKPREDATQWRRMIGARIGDVWDFQ